MTALELNEMEQTLTRNTRLMKILFDCYWLVSWATITVYSAASCTGTRSCSSGMCVLPLAMDQFVDLGQWYDTFQ